MRWFFGGGALVGVVGMACAPKLAMPDGPDACAATGPTAVRIAVRGDDGPVAGAPVRVLDTAGDVVCVTHSDASGWTGVAVDAGDYVVRSGAAGIALTAEADATRITALHVR